VAELRLGVEHPQASGCVLFDRVDELSDRSGCPPVLHSAVEVVDEPRFMLPALSRFLMTLFWSLTRMSTHRYWERSTLLLGRAARRSTQRGAANPQDREGRTTFPSPRRGRFSAKAFEGEWALPVKLPSRGSARKRDGRWGGQ
jgi:hypothetical protein